MGTVAGAYPAARATERKTDPYTGFSAAKRRYAEQFGDVIVDRNYLRLGLLAVSVVAVAAAGLAWKAYSVVENFRPVVIRVDKVGRAEAVRYPEYGYAPQEPEIRYFLREFARLLWTRNRFALESNLKMATSLMSRELAAQETEAWKRSKLVENYSKEPIDVDVSVERIVISQLKTPPYQATVDFEQVFYAAGTREVSNRLLYTMTVVFDFRSEVPADVAETNPLGLQVKTYRAQAVTP